MSEIQDKMNAIKHKTKPTKVEMKKYIRYALNVLHQEPDDLQSSLKHWNQDQVLFFIKSFEMKKRKPKPKRYYVSLKEPLEDGALR